MTLEQLPPKGVKREQAILELGKDEANGELLFQLVNTEKGKCKTAAQKALAQLEYAPAAPLWAKLVKGKWMGSNIMSDACSDCVSEQIAPVILKTLSQLLDEGDTKPLNIEQLNFCFHLMLGKASPKMLEVYRFLAENTQRIAQLKRAPVYSDDDCTSWWITDGLRIWDATPKEKEKIPAVVLTASLIRNPDERLQALADELNERYGGSWLMPVFMKAIITQPKEQVYETYSPLLDTPQKGYLFHALGMLHYRCYPEDWTYERLGPDGMIALIFWGDYSYGTYDTRFMIERYVDLDERWLFDLAKDPEGRKPTVTWQTYNRGGVLYGSYDEMFISLLPLKVENPELKRVLWDYFRIRMKDLCQYGNRPEDEWEILPWIPDPRPPFKIWVKPEQIAPFFLIPHHPYAISLLLKISDGFRTEEFRRLGLIGSSEDWERLARGVIQEFEENNSGVDLFHFDSDEDVFCVYSQYIDDLMLLSKMIRAACDNEKTMGMYLNMSEVAKA